MCHAYIAPRTELGIGTMVKSNTCIGHDVKCGPLCHFAMGSITGSLVVIGKCADVSIGATVLEKRKIGNLPDSEIHVGLPAKFLRRIMED